MTYGLIGRADRGGTASQTWEVAAHVPPAKVLIVDLGPRGRGPTDPARYDALCGSVRVAHGYPGTEDWEWLLDGVETVYTVETPYDDHLPALCSAAHVRLVIHANPELWRESYRGPTTQVVVPTRWERQRIPRCRVLPMPVARERIPHRHRAKAERFLFPRAPAMKDRNGEQLLLAALRHVDRPFELVVGGCKRDRELKMGKGRIHHRASTEDYWTIYDEADVLVLPRRYGGLSLPMQEAAAAGMAIVTLDLEPYREFVHPAGLVAPCDPEQGVHMKGGEFTVWSCDPRLLGAKLADLLEDDALVSEMSTHSDAWAQSISWDVWAPKWREVLAR